MCCKCFLLSVTFLFLLLCVLMCLLIHIVKFSNLFFPVPYFKISFPRSGAYRYSPRFIYKNALLHFDIEIYSPPKVGFCHVVDYRSNFFLFSFLFFVSLLWFVFIVWRLFCCCFWIIRPLNIHLICLYFLSLSFIVFFTKVLRIHFLDLYPST